MVLRTEATGVFLVRRRTFFRLRFRLNRGKSWRSESSTLCLNMSSFPSTRARRSNHCESERIFVQTQHRQGENYEIFSIALFHRSVFVCVVDVAPNVKFRRSWCRRKACITFFLKVQALHKGELRFARYDLANRDCWNVPHAGRLFSDRDSCFTGGALDDSGVARCSSSNPLT